MGVTGIALNPTFQSTKLTKLADNFFFRCIILVIFILQMQSIFVILNPSHNYWKKFHHLGTRHLRPILSIWFFSSQTNFELGITVWFDRTLAFVGVKVLASAPADEYQQIKRDLKL